MTIERMQVKTDDLRNCILEAEHTLGRLASVLAITLPEEVVRRPSDEPVPDVASSIFDAQAVILSHLQEDVNRVSVAASVILSTVLDGGLQSNRTKTSVPERAQALGVTGYPGAERDAY